MTQKQPGLASLTPVLLSLVGLVARVAAGTVSVVVPGLGRVVGRDFGDYHAFLDIPFGLSTAGEYRWAAPRPVAAWENGTLDATAFRDGCAGANKGGDPVGPDAQSFSEDCLNLRIWAPPPSTDPGADPGGQLPVAVWLHGGGFMFGTTGDPMYDGRAYARDHGTVLVSLNYRLGALGFLATPNEGGDAKYDLSGNYGLLDQQLGLRWVQDHIQAFGGDPSRVLLFGQSAGAMSIVCHLASPASHGLFHAAEIRSPVGLHYQNAAEAKAHAGTLATALGCLPFGEGIVPCLRKKSFADIVKMQLAPEYIRHLTDPGHGINWLEWVPTVGNTVLPREPHDIIVNNGSWNRVPLIIGSMRNETNAWLPTALEDESIAKLVFDSVMRINWGKGSSDRVAAAYSHAGLTWFELVGLSSTDWLMSCYCRRLARAAAKQGVPTFLYQFLHPNSKFGDPTNAMQPFPSHPACVDGRAACHAGDNMYTMGSVDLIPNASFTVFEANLSSLIIATTARLAESIGGDYDSIVRAVAPLVPYDGVSSLAWGGVFDQESGREVLHSVIAGWRGDVCDFWDTMTPTS